MAASEVATALRLARSAAVRHSSRVGVKFETAGDFVVYNLYRDGDGDGVRTADIRNGTDPAIGLLRPLAHLGGRVDFGFPPGPPPTDPSDPDRTLGNLDDPIRFNNSDIASFSPLGESTPGSVYISDGQRQLVVVRLYGRTGRVRVLRWNATSRRWILVG